MPQVRKRAAAKRDPIANYVYLAGEAGLDVAERFLASAADCFNQLARHPHTGAAIPTAEPRLSGMRKWRIHGFPSFLVFYLLSPQGVTIVRAFARREAGGPRK